MLGSGSRGNGLLVECGGTRVLVDCGFPLKEAERRLVRLGVEPDSLAAVVLTHEHSDHASGADRFTRRHGVSLWLTSGTGQALGLPADAGNNIHYFETGAQLAIGDIGLQSYAVPHDAREPCQFVFTNGVRRLGLLTDAGHVTPHMTATLQACDALILECNHEPDLLRDCEYPPSVKARIGGSHGHLGNDAAAALLACLDTARLQHIVAAHLSERTNTPWLARAALGSALGGAAERVAVAGQDSGLPWRELV